MIEKTYKAIESEQLSDANKERFVIVDIQTGEILDDAQGYGYKSLKAAYAAYGYKTRDKSKDEQNLEIDFTVGELLRIWKSKKWYK